MALTHAKYAPNLTARTFLGGREGLLSGFGPLCGPDVWLGGIHQRCGFGRGRFWPLCLEVVGDAPCGDESVKAWL